MRPGGPAISHHPIALKWLWATKSHVHFISHKYYRSWSLSLTHTYLFRTGAPDRLVTSSFLQQSNQHAAVTTAAGRGDITVELLCQSRCTGTSEDSLRVMCVARTPQMCDVTSWCAWGQQTLPQPTTALHRDRLRNTRPDGSTSTFHQVSEQTNLQAPTTARSTVGDGVECGHRFLG